MGQRINRLTSGGDGHDLDVLVAEQFNNGLSLNLVVLNDQQPFRAWSAEVLEPAKHCFQAVSCRLLYVIGEGTVGEAVLPFFHSRDDLDWYVPRAWIEFELPEHRPTMYVRQ